MDKRNEQGLYFPERQGSCSIRISKKPILKEGDRTLQMWSNVDPPTTARLLLTNGNLAVDIYDGRSRRFARMEFSSLATLLCVLYGGSLESLSTEGYGFRIPRNLKRLGWLGAVSWLRSILPTFFETLGSPLYLEKTSSASEDYLTERSRPGPSEQS